MEPNMRFPRVNMRLTATTESRKKPRPRNVVKIRHRHRHCLSLSIFLVSSSERGRSSVKSASGLPPGYKKKQTFWGRSLYVTNDVTFMFKVEGRRGQKTHVLLDNLIWIINCDYGNDREDMNMIWRRKCSGSFLFFFSAAFKARLCPASVCLSLSVLW